jgi:hypothetical protein
MHYLKTSIFKIDKQFYLDRGSSSGNTIPLTEQIKNIYWLSIKDTSSCYESHTQDFRPLKLKLLDNGTQKFILKARNNILPNFCNISKSSGSSKCLFCNADDTNIHFIHCQNMDNNQDLISLVQNFWNKFSNSNWINWDWILKGWINKSNIRRLDTKEIKDYDQKKLEIILSLQKRWNLRCSLIKKTSPAVMLSSQDEDTPADETPSVL